LRMCRCGFWYQYLAIHPDDTEGLEQRQQMQEAPSGQQNI
jgi:hypothetical protein